MSDNGYTIEIAFCIDNSKSMRVMLDEVKTFLKSIYSTFENRFAYGNKILDEIRSKIILFNDIGSGPNAIKSSNFYSLPNQINEFNNEVDNINLTSSTNYYSSGFEAIYEAIKCDWNTEKSGNKYRRVIVVISNNLPIKLGERSKCLWYKKDYPTDIYALEDIYDNWELKEGVELSVMSKRIFLFVPDYKDKSGCNYDDVKGWRFASSIDVDFKGNSELYPDGLLEEYFKS